MKHLYRLFILRMVLVIVLSICAISSGKEQEDCRNKASVNCIKERDYIIAGVRPDIPLFGYKSPDDKSDPWRGFEVDLMKEFAQCWLKDEKKIRFVDVPADDRIDVVNKGLVDILAGIFTHNKSREVKVGFSQTYFRDRTLSFLVRKADLGSLLPSYGRFEEIAQQLIGKKGVTPKGSTTALYFREESARYSIKLTPLNEEQNYKAMVDDLRKNNGIDFVFSNEAVLKGYEKLYPELTVISVTQTPPTPTEPSEPYAIGLKKENEDLKSLVNNTLQELAVNGRYKEIFEKWFNDPEIWPLYAIEVFPGERTFSPFDNSCKKGAPVAAKPARATPAIKIAAPNKLEEKITFPSKDYILNKENIETIENLIRKSSLHKPEVIIVSGYTDYIGNDEINKYLSQKRAEAVKSLLVQKGFAESQIMAKGCSKDSNAPRDKASPDSRRVEIKFLFQPQVITVCP